MLRPVEFETKLVLLPGATLDPDDVVAEAAAIGRLVGGPEQHHLQATYFDTPDGRLRAARWTLRCRTADGSPVATLKGPGPRVAGLRARVEHELALPAVARPGHPLPPGLLMPLRDAGLALERWPEELFGTDVRRTVAGLDVNGARLELAIDVGLVRAGDHRAPVAEVELELRAGSPAALVRAAGQLAERLPVRPGGRAKAARGLQLLGLLRPPEPPPSDAPRAALWEGLCELEELRREGDSRFAADHERLREALGIAPGPEDHGWVSALWLVQTGLAQDVR